jgi:hypothetical protein
MCRSASSPRVGRTGTRAARDDLMKRETRRETRIGWEEERKRREERR